ncbi:MAG TPA: YdcF family protein [Bryobacteraceae bacterium]|nr:YdcF family protein [Bryobacteraceae bacterium]
MKNVWIKLRRGAVLICAALGLAMLLATFSPFVGWYARRLAGPWNDPRGDILIVISGANLGEFPDENTVLRCLSAVLAYRQGGFRKIVVSGYRTSIHMRSLLIAEGVPPDAVVMEGAATSTRENALYVARLLANDPGSKVLMTSDYHMFRAVRAFRKAGLKVAPRPIPDALKRVGNPSRLWQAFVEESVETVKIAGYAFRGWI